MLATRSATTGEYEALVWAPPWRDARSRTVWLRWNVQFTEYLDLRFRRVRAMVRQPPPLRVWSVIDCLARDGLTDPLIVTVSPGAGSTSDGASVILARGRWTLCVARALPPPESARHAIGTSSSPRRRAIAP
jgi:hypothetical protein